MNILGKGQERLSKTFAAKVDDRFAEVSTRTDTTGALVLSHALPFS